jgi:hypothetical protein
MILSTIIFQGNSRESDLIFTECVRRLSKKAEAYQMLRFPGKYPSPAGNDFCVFGAM